jgi:ClpP class serine protease
MNINPLMNIINHQQIAHFALGIITCTTSIVSYYAYYIYKSFRLIKNIESKYKSKVIYIRDTKESFIDQTLMYIYKNYIISINDNYSLRNILQKNYEKNITIILCSRGGYISSSDSMLNLLSIHKPTKSVFIPSYAKSAATLLALSCDEIYMNKYATMGPTDPQISVFDSWTSFSTIDSIVQAKSTDKINDELLIAYYENKKLYDDNVSVIKKYINKHKKKNINIGDVSEIVKMFSFGDIAHHSELSFDRLNKVININCDIPKNILELYSLLNYIFQII